MTEQKETDSFQTTATETGAESTDVPEETSLEVKPSAVEKPEEIPEEPAVKEKVADKGEPAEMPPGTGGSGDEISGEEGEEAEKGGDRSRDKSRRDHHRGGHGRRGDRPLTNEEKLRIYKKQSEERLLDIKRSREAKVGKKKK